MRKRESGQLPNETGVEDEADLAASVPLRFVRPAPKEFRFPEAISLRPESRSCNQEIVSMTGGRR